MESPVIVEQPANFSTPVNVETGFPFDDSDYDSSDHFQFRLNDLAQRHPELAGHLRFDEFPSLRRKRYGSGSSSAAGDADQPQDPTRPAASTSSRFADHSFPTGFKRFPFTSSFEEEFAGEPRREEKPPEVPKQYNQSDKRGRKPNPYLPQHLSNTVDLGQKQPPVEESRSQRSMSAPPPENRSTQSTQFRNNEASHQNPQSEMGGTSGRPRQSPNKPQEQSRQERTPPRQAPHEHFIPIRVEGRDELLHPMKENIHQSGSGEKVFTSGMPNTKNVNFSSPRPQDFHNTPRHDQQTPKQTSQQVPRQKPQPNREEQPTPPPIVNDPIVKITRIRDDVRDLMNKVESFQGTRKDREFMYLDEMLTRNLLKLDNIETEGKENIRNARKEAIRCIQDCLNRLEKQAQAKEAELKAATLQIAECNPSTDIIEAEQQQAADTKEVRKSSITINVNAYANTDGGLIEPEVALDSKEPTNMDTASILSTEPNLTPALPVDAPKTDEFMDTQHAVTSEVPTQQPQNTTSQPDLTPK